MARKLHLESEDTLMSNRTITENLKIFGINQALKLVKDDPDRNLPKLLKWVERLDKDDVTAGQREVIKPILSDPNNNWYKFIKSMWTDIDDSVRAKFFENFIANVGVVSAARQRQNTQKYNCNIPWAILMDPTSACNLGCTGCWAAEYGDRLSMTYETLDDIINQGKEIGVFMYIYSGGEPMMRKNDIIRLCEKHDDCMFLAFTNGTLIDEAFTDEMLRVKNFIPAISIEGFEEETDDRRGKGTYQKVITAMELLQKKKLIFGASCCYTSKNAEIMGSDEYFDDLVSRGAKFAWFFTYMPVGVGAPTDLLATDAQREHMYHKIREFRQTKPIFTMDFWNDGEFVDGCIAGGRKYLHINANGDIEPCAFIHYADSNIHEDTLLEALQKPLFMQYYQNQPFNDNMLRPCPLLDNQGKLAEMVHISGAHSTDLSQPEDIDDLTAKCKDVADRWQVTSERLWACSNMHNCQGNCSKQEEAI